MRIQDLKGNVPIEVYKINWSWGKKTEFWLARHVKGLFVLHVCCGMSKVGNIRVDIDRSVKPDIIADVDHLPFRPGTFDVVICDPPFKKYNRFKWINRLADYSKGIVILSAPGGVFPRIKGYKREYFAILTLGTFFVRYFIKYSKRNQSLVEHLA